MEGSPAHYVSPPIHDKPISDRGEEYVNERTVQDDRDEQSVKQNGLSSKIPRKKHPRASESSTSRHPDAPDARPTTTATSVPSSRGMYSILAQQSIITKSAKLLVPPQARALHPKLEEAFRPMVHRLQPVLKQASRSDSWIRRITNSSAPYERYNRYR